MNQQDDFDKELNGEPEEVLFVTKEELMLLHEALFYFRMELDEAAGDGAHASEFGEHTDPQLAAWDEKAIELDHRLEELGGPARGDLTPMNQYILQRLVETGNAKSARERDRIRALEARTLRMKPKHETPSPDKW